MIVIRPALPAEVDAVRELATAAYRPHVAGVGREPAPMLADHEAEIRAGIVRVAEVGGRIAGHLVLVRHPDHVLVETLAVHPDAQGRGLGSALLLHAEAYAVAVGVGEVRLFTNEAMTGNLAFYPRRGYTETRRAVDDGFRRVFFTKRL